MSTTNQSTVTPSGPRPEHSPSVKYLTDPSVIGMDVAGGSTFPDYVDIVDHRSETSLDDLLNWYDQHTEHGSYAGVTLGDTEFKGQVAFDAIRGNRVLIELEPAVCSRINEAVDDGFDRWEPFLVAYPAVAKDNQLKFTNVVPLSQLAYQVQRYEDHVETTTSDSDAARRRVMHAKHKAVTHYEMTACMNGDVDEPLNDRELANNNELLDTLVNRGIWISAKNSSNNQIVHAIHTTTLPSQDHLLIGSNDEGELYTGRDSFGSDDADVVIGVDRRANTDGERKVAVFNGEDTKEPLNQLQFSETHRRFLGPLGRWEVDMDSLETVIQGVLQHDSVNFVSVHQMTEQFYHTEVDSSFFGSLDGYEPKGME